MKVYKIETLGEYAGRGGKVVKFRPANAVRSAYPKRPADPVKMIQRLSRWRAA
jgi:hypothetical protein